MPYNVFQTVSQDDINIHDSQVTKWAKRLWSAIKEVTYKEAHEDIFKEFEKFRDAAQGRDDAKVTMLDHVTLIYNHIASHGFQPHIHYQPIKDAVSRFCERKPVADWKGPQEQLSRSPSPNQEPIPSPPKISPINAGPLKKKGKAKILDEVIRSDAMIQRENLPNHESPSPPQMGWN